MTVYTPGQVAEETGFSLDTLRYYERIGLLEPVERNAAGQRRFSDDDVGWLGMVRCLRDTGMSIAEMLRFAELVRLGDDSITERVRLLEAHDREVEAQIAGLHEKHEAIRRKIAYYRTLASLSDARPTADRPSVRCASSGASDTAPSGRAPLTAHEYAPTGS